MTLYSTRDTSTHNDDQQALFGEISPQLDAPEHGNERAHLAPLDNYAKSVGKFGADLAENVASEQQQHDETTLQKSDTVFRSDTSTIRRVSEQREKRWQLARLLWDFSALKRVRHCKRYLAMRHTSNGPERVDEVEVRRSQDGEAVGYSGLQTCGSVWACPACSARIQAQRRLELGLLMAAAAEQGYCVVFTTYTLRHKAGQPLAGLWDGLSYAHRRVKQDKTVSKLRKGHGEVGSVRATEVTYGQNGWHPHMHSLRFYAKPLNDRDVAELRRNEFRAWKAAAKSRGLGRPSLSAFKMELVDIGDEETANNVGKYLVKQIDDKTQNVERLIEAGKQLSGITFEMQGGATKAARRSSSYTPMELLGEFAETGNVDFLDRFNEYELASKGKRALIWSPGLKQQFKVAEKTDEAIAAESIGTKEDRVFGITEEGWQQVCQMHAAARILNTLNFDGIAAAKELCDALGIDIND